MNLEENYRAWKDRLTPLNVPPDFAADVMRRVHSEAGQLQARRNWPALLKSLQRNVSFQYAALTIAALAGLSRLWLIFFAILKP